MNIKKIKKAFTLVELIVVITILAILATIAFISFQGSTSEANNTKVVSDVRNLVAKVSIVNGMGTSIKSLFLSGSTTNKPNSLVVYGGKTPTENDVGKINFGILQESSSDFKDKKNEPEKDYLFGYAFGGNSVGGALNNYSYFQVAGELVDNNGGKTVIIKGNYTPMHIGTDSPSLISEKIDNTIFLTNGGDATNMY